MASYQQAESVARNTIYYTSALIVQKVLAFVYFSLIARVMGVEATGKYTFALSFTTLFAIFIDLGLAAVLTRETAKEWGKAKRYLSNVLALKIPLAVVTYLFVVAMVNILGYPELTKNLVYLAGMVMFIDSFSLSFWAVMRGSQQLKYESVGIIVLQLTTVGLGGLVLYFKLGLVWLIGALLAGSLLNLVLAIVAVRRKLKFNFIPHYEPRVLRSLFQIGIPFALAGIFSRVYHSIDTVLLSILAGDRAVGWYSIPIKITLALQFLPMAFMAALFPAMSRYFVEDKQRLARMFERAMYYLMFISVPMAAGIFVLAEPVIIQVYTIEYLNSILPLKILMVALFFLFINFPVGYLLNACNKQVTNTVNLGITVLVSVILNIVLIPRFSYVGSAIALLASTVVYFILGMYWVGKIIDYNRYFLVKSLIKVLIAALVMAWSIYYLMRVYYNWHWLLMVPIGAVVYVGVIWLLKGVTKEEVRELWQSIKQS